MLKLSQVDHASMDHTGGSSVQVDICPVTGGSSVQVDICPVTGGSSIQVDICPVTGGSSVQVDICPVTGGSSVQVDICPVTGGSSVQVDICTVTASFTWHNVLKVHPGFCTLQDFLPFKGQIIFHCVYMWHFLGPCIHSGTFEKFQLSIVKISNCKHVGKGRSVNTRNAVFTSQPCSPNGHFATSPVPVSETMYHVAGTVRINIMCVHVLSRVRLSATPRTVAR